MKLQKRKILVIMVMIYLNDKYYINFYEIPRILLILCNYEIAYIRCNKSYKQFTYSYENTTDTINN
jgi:hypothetical protein